jgi:hypothetical protein
MLVRSLRYHCPAGLALDEPEGEFLNKFEEIPYVQYGTDVLLLIHVLQGGATNSHSDVWRVHVEFASTLR